MPPGWDVPSINLTPALSIPPWNTPVGRGHQGSQGRPREREPGAGMGEHPYLGCRGSSGG